MTRRSPLSRCVRSRAFLRSNRPGGAIEIAITLSTALPATKYRAPPLRVSISQTAIPMMIAAVANRGIAPAHRDREHRAGAIGGAGALSRRRASSIGTTVPFLFAGVRIALARRAGSCNYAKCNAAPHRLPVNAFRKSAARRRPPSLGTKTAAGTSAFTRPGI